MATLIQDEKLVRSVTGSQKWAVCGSASISPGQLIYIDNTDPANPVAELTDATLLAKALVSGFALSNANPGERVQYQQPNATEATSSRIVPGAVLKPGDMYGAARDAPGGIAPLGDYLTGDFPVAIGFAKDTSEIEFTVQAAQVAVGA